MGFIRFSCMKKISVFCGSRNGNGTVFVEEARSLAAVLVREGIDLVYGGASVGLMGVLADEVLSGGGKVYGVIPQHICDLEVAHENLTELHVVDSMHTRKALMADLADAFIAMPGGFGTLDELCEIITWSQLGLHKKPIGVLNSAGFFDHFRQHIRESVRHGFVSAEDEQMCQFASEPGQLIELLKSRQ